MRPDWLRVPAANWGSRESGQAGNSGRARVVLFVADHGRADPLPNEGVAALIERWSMPTHGDVLQGLPGGLDLDIEILDPGTVGWLGSISDRTSGRERLDTHRLDVALSAGRHAAERAKLAGRGLLIGVGRGEGGASVDRDRHHRWPEATTACWLRLQARALVDPYEALGRLGCFEIAACVGMAIAGAQIGVPVLLRGTDADITALLAVSLHPGLGGWLSVGGGIEWPLSATNGSVRHSLLKDARAAVEQKVSA